jgi:hypothetical protein
MAKLAWKGSKLVITLATGDKILFTIKKVRGCLTYNIYKGEVKKGESFPMVLKGGFLTLPEAKSFLLQYVSNWK